LESHLGLKTIDQMRDGSEGEDENDYDLPSGIKLGLENAYTSNKSKRGNHTDRKSV
tara:strand:+ start:2778 stop:2945 length:168 start_codon:yes stop_codon:yes gene_type:complete